MTSLTTEGYISSWDGKASKLVVQATDEIYDNDITSTYRRTFIRNVAPRFLRLANWPYSHVDPNLNDGKPTNQGQLGCQLLQGTLIYYQTCQCFASSGSSRLLSSRS